MSDNPILDDFNKQIESLKNQIKLQQEELAKLETIKKAEIHELIKNFAGNNNNTGFFYKKYQMFLLLLLMLILFGVGFASYNFIQNRKMYNQMLESMQKSEQEINFLNSYIGWVDDNLQLIPDALKQGFEQNKQLSLKQFSEVNTINAKSDESFTKIDNIENKSEKLIGDITTISEKSEQAIDKIKSLETNIVNQREVQISKIEDLQSESKENKNKVKILIEQEQKEKILVYLNKYKENFNYYKTKNDLSLLFKMVLIDEMGNVSYHVIIEAFKKYKFKNFDPPDMETLMEWDKNMVDLCNNAIAYIKSFDASDAVNKKDRYFNTFKAEDDYSNYKKWGYFDETLNYADLILFYQNTLNSVKSRIEFNKTTAQSGL